MIKGKVMNKEIEKKGHLELILQCLDCNSLYVLSQESIIQAVSLNTSFQEYLDYVHKSKCRNCYKKNIHKEIQ